MDLAGVLQGVYVNIRLLVRFHDGCANDLTLNQITTVTVEKRLVTKEAKVPTIYVIPENNIDF